MLERAAEAAESTGRDKEFSSQAKATAKFAIQASPTSKYLITECGETLRTGAFFIYNDISNKPTATPQVNKQRGGDGGGGLACRTCECVCVDGGGGGSGWGGGG